MKAMAPTATCNARTRTGAHCRLRAGFRTPHVGRGRCYLHGGLTPVKSGRYSKIHVAELWRLMEQHAEDPEPLNLLPDLAAARALFEDYINRAAESPPADGSERPPLPAIDWPTALDMLSEISRIVKRIEDVRASNAIGRPDLLRVMQEMFRVVNRYVTDDEVLERIKDGWLAIHVG